MQTIKVANNGMLTYKYDVSDEISCAFHLLCEVGEPYQQAFIDEIAERGMTVETRSLDCAPWVADFAK